MREFLSFLAGRAITGVIDQIIIVVSVGHFGAAASQWLAGTFGWLDAAIWLSLWSMGCKVVSNVVVIVLNYIFSKLFIFKKKD